MSRITTYGSGTMILELTRLFHYMKWRKKKKENQTISRRTQTHARVRTDERANDFGRERLVEKSRHVYLECFSMSKRSVSAPFLSLQQSAAPSDRKYIRYYNKYVPMYTLGQAAETCRCEDNNIIAIETLNATKQHII